MRARLPTLALLLAMMSLSLPSASANVLKKLNRLLKGFGHSQGGPNLSDDASLALFPKQIHVTLGFDSQASGVRDVFRDLFGGRDLYECIPRIAGAPNGSIVHVSATPKGQLAIRTEHDFYLSEDAYLIGQGRSRIVANHEGIRPRSPQTRPHRLLSLVTQHRIEAAARMNIWDLWVQLIDDDPARRQHFAQWGYQERPHDLLYFDAKPGSHSMKVAAKNAEVKGLPFRDSHEYIVVNR